MCARLSTTIFHSLHFVLSPVSVCSSPPPLITRMSAAGVVGHFCVRAEAELSYVIHGGISVEGELRLAGLSRPVPGLDDGLAQTGDPLLPAKGVVGLQAVRVKFGAPSAAHAETVFHWDGMERNKEGN